jgi:hypothetical protein
MKYLNVVCRGSLTILIVVPLLFASAATEESNQATTETALEQYEKSETEVGTRTAVVAGGQKVNLASSKLSPEQWKAMGPNGTDLIPK